MAQPILALGMRFEVAKTFGSAVNSQSISQAATASVASTGHGFTTNDVVMLNVPNGMTQLDQQAARIAVTDAGNYTLPNINSTGFSASAAGASARRVTVWDTLSGTRSFTAPLAEPARVDITSLEDTRKKEMFGLDDAQRFTLEGYFDAFDPALVTIAAISRAKSIAPVRVTFPNGRVLVFSAYLSGGENFGAQPGEAFTTQVAMTLVGNPVWYAS